MKKKWIRLIKDFELEAYGKMIYSAGAEMFLPVDDSEQAIITVGHGHTVKIPKEFWALRDEKILDSL
jgi:hypothetical protein